MARRFPLPRRGRVRLANGIAAVGGLAAIFFNDIRRPARLPGKGRGFKAITASRAIVEPES
jgi:hypothetical protein